MNLIIALIIIALVGFFFMITWIFSIIKHKVKMAFGYKLYEYVYIPGHGTPPSYYKYFKTHKDAWEWREKKWDTIRQIKPEYVSENEIIDSLD